MTAITASLVKALRDKTGAGMMDCKKALAESGGDTERAVDWLRAKGLAAAARKAGRTAAEGLIGAAAEGASGALVEVNSETDFVARNADFQRFVAAAAQAARAAGGNAEALKNATFPGTGRTVSAELTELMGRIGENLVLRRSAALSVERGLVSSYVHNAAAPGMGRIGVLVALQSDAAPDALAAIGKQLAMQVAASRPLAVSHESVDPDALARERAVLSDQARQSGRPDHVIAKMVEGRLRKWYEDIVLPDQLFIIDGKSRVRDAVAAAAKDAGAAIEIADFARFEIGEGIEKREADFAAEVAAQAGAR